VPAEVPRDVADALLRAIEADPSLQVVVDVEQRRVSAPAAGIDAAFPLDDFTQWRLLNGLDDIGLTLRHAEAIGTFERSRSPLLPAVTPD
jgi:3-isopropylmalate/(R)-2-methylmalate dehydratase small subunit